MTPLPTLRQLRYLIALADHGHFGRAADACLVTQSTLSAGLQELESVLGVALAERTKRKVMLTPLGLEVVDRARRLLVEAQGLVDAVRAADAPLSGALRLGVIPTIAPYLLPRILPALRRQFPNLKLILREDLSARLTESLREGHLDVLLLALPWLADGVETIDLADDPFFLVLPPDHPLAKQEIIEPQDLPLEELLLLEEGHCLRDHALAACHLLYDPGREHSLSGTSLATLVQMVAGGLGVTLLPQMAVSAGALAGTGLVARSLGSSGAKRRIGMLWRSTSPRKVELTVLARVFAHEMADGGVKA